VWFNQHYKEIESKYDERWIVINQGAIIHSDTNLDILFKRLRNQYNYIGSLLNTWEHPNIFQFIN
jgi:hypothetical protein